ncbi:MAG: enamine deaminase RidA (YjgF/YER057c/UK114 family) [Paracoccaceae bacterium]|jgi:enamine deaminase RidA (YjgF/YER057c/UK114 family)
MKALNPPGWNRPKGYSNGIAAEGRFVFVAGMVGWTAEEKFESDDFVDQFRLALENTVAVLKEGDAGPEHICRMTMYFTDKQEYLSRLPEVGQAYRDVIGKNFPTMAAVVVVALMEDRAKVEIETTAIVPV